MRLGGARARWAAALAGTASQDVPEPGGTQSPGAVAALPLLCCSAAAAEIPAWAWEGFKIIWSFAEQQEALTGLGGARFLPFAQKAAVRWGQGSSGAVGWGLML